MAGAFGGYDEEEEDVLAPKEPQVTSQDPGERKAGRALRIKRRKEAIKKAEQPAEEAAIDEEPGPIEQATASAAEELQRLTLDGAAKVTNVSVTADEREVNRRRRFAEKMQDSNQKIEEEANDAQIQYEVITTRWGEMLEIKDPLDIEAALKEQKQKCDDLLNQKNEIISELKEDLKRMDQAYYDDLDMQDNDIKELGERIEKQITIMKRAYEKQLYLIEQAINIERGVMVEHNNKRWEALYKQRDREEMAHMEYKFERLEEQKQEIEAIMWDHHQKYREAKIELESLIQELQKELEKLKATCIINTEKIGYNYQVLKKREEENVFVRSQQKRKLNKMSDVANSLRTKIRKAAEDGAIEEMKADQEIMKLIEAMDELEKKSLHFSHVNHYKFSQVWRMSVARCGQLARQVRQAEVALHAHILSEPPPPPPPPPPKSPLSKLVIVVQQGLQGFAGKSFFLAEHEEEMVKATFPVEGKGNVDANNMLAVEAKDRLIRHILQLVADNTGFLVEDRLFKLIEKYQLSARNLCTLDAIFMALEIQAEEDVELLCKTFLNYAFCPICVGMEIASENVEPSMSQEDDASLHPSVKGTRGEKMSMRGRASVARSISVSTSRSAHVGYRAEMSPADQLLMAEADEIIQKCGEGTASTLVSGAAAETAGQRTLRAGARGVTVSAQPEVSTRNQNPYLCPVGHYLEIEPTQVLTALGEFISVFVPPEKKKLYDLLDSVKPPNFDTPSRKLKTEEIESYWTQWKNMFPTEKDRFWDGLLRGLNNYLPILQERERIHDEVMVLRRRNAALRRLVRGALPELPRPPPKYARPYPPGFTAPVPDDNPEPFARLPPIQ